MPIPILCPCSARLKVGDHLKGLHIKCPRCGAVHPVGAVHGNSVGHARPEAPPDKEQVLAAGGLADDERERLEAELESGEQLLWAGKPVERRVYLRNMAIVGSGLFFGAFVLGLILVILLTQSQLDVHWFILLLMGIAAAGCVAGGFLWPAFQRRRARQTVYAATSKRALAWVPDWYGKVALVVYQPEDLAKLYRVEVTRDADAVGSLIFGVHVTRKETREGIIEKRRVYGFFFIRQAAAVERLMREALVNPLLDRIYE